MMNKSWEKLGTIRPKKLSESRLQLHYAIQFIAATGSALVEPLPDYSHVSLTWNPELEIFVGAMVQAKQPFQVALDPISLTSIILDKQGDTIAALPLHENTLAEGLNWLKQQISKLGVDADSVTFLSYPSDFPDSAFAHGTPFDASDEITRQELTNYYANTHQLLAEIVAITEEASAIHIWPHHFDIATLISLPGTKNGEPMTVGIGLSPGDTNYNEPYWYVSPYPYPDKENLPPIDGDGFWHTQHWVGAVLPASRLLISSSEDLQRQQVESFLKSALQASRALLNF
jgi:hypothetical protein